MLTLNSYSYHIFMDNYFTSFLLLTHLGVYLSVFNSNALNYIRVTGGLNKNMLSKCTITGGKQLQKKERYHFEQCISSKKGSTSLTVAGWKNNREVYIDSSESSESKRFVRRWNKVEKSISKKTAKFIPLLQSNHEFCQQNGPEHGQAQDWLPNEKVVVVPVSLNCLYCSSEVLESLPLLALRRDVVTVIFLKYSKEGRSSSSHLGIRHVPSDFSYVDTKHYQMPFEKQGRCKV